MTDDDLTTHCDHCGKPMIIAPPPTGHYCSPACRVRAFRARKSGKAPVKPASETRVASDAAAKLAEYERLVAAGRAAAGAPADDADAIRYADGEPLKDRLGRNITVHDVDEVATALHRIRKVLKARPDLDAGTIRTDEEGGDLSDGFDQSFRESIFEDDDKPQFSDLRLLAFELELVADDLEEAQAKRAGP